MAAAERVDPLAAEAPAVRDGSGLHVLVAGLEPERPAYIVARVDS